MPNQSLPDLTERTATADTDLVHVNSGGSDYKQTKANFLQGDLYHVFDNTSLLTAQIDALPSMGTFFGRIASFGAQSVTGVPANSNGDVFVQKFNGNYIVVDFHPIGNSDATYRKCKNSGTWESSWTKLPSRSEITSLNNSLTNSLFVDTDNKTSYSFPVTPPGGSFGYFLLFGGTTSADTSNVFFFIGMVANGNVQFARLCGTQNFTGTISNGVCTIASTNTVWGGIRVISIN